MPPPPKPKPRSSPESPAKKFVDSQQPEPSKTNSKVRFPLQSNTAIDYGTRVEDDWMRNKINHVKIENECPLLRPRGT